MKTRPTGLRPDFAPGSDLLTAGTRSSAYKSGHPFPPTLWSCLPPGSAPYQSELIRTGTMLIEVPICSASNRLDAILVRYQSGTAGPVPILPEHSHPASGSSHCLLSALRLPPMPLHVYRQPCTLPPTSPSSHRINAASQLSHAHSLSHFLPVESVRDHPKDFQPLDYVSAEVPLGSRCFSYQVRDILLVLYLFEEHHVSSCRTSPY